VGIVEVSRTAYPDHTQFDPKSKYHDAASPKENPRWLMVDVTLKEKLGGIVSLEELKKHKDSGPLKDMVLLAKSRLSVQPVRPAEWDFIQTLIEGLGSD
jgi:predicted RNA-binding protein with PUA-like domain